MLVALGLSVAPVASLAADGEPAAPLAPAERPADPWDTFVYERPEPVYRLRLAIEEVSMVGVAYIGYVIENPPPSYPGVPSTSVWSKLRFAPDSWYFDDDELATNFTGHAVSGTLYYMVARGNRVSIPEAFLWTLGAATLWELIEFKEPVSFNDIWVGTAGGMAIGEAFTQLSSYFDRGTDRLSQALAWIFDPFKKIHDWVDGAVPLRDPATRGWHEFQALASAGLLTQGGPVYGAVEIAASTRLFRAPGYGEAGGAGFGFADGNVSALGITATFAGHQTVDFLFDTETALLGYYARQLKNSAAGQEGWDLFVGGTAGYEFGSHVWNLAGPATKNQIAAIRFPGVDVRARIFSGPFRVTLAVDLALAFAGVEPLGAPGSLPPGAYYPTVYLANGYYYGLGLHLAPHVEMRWDSLTIGGAACIDDFLMDFKGPFVPPPPGPVASMQDGRSLATAWLRWRVTDPSLEFALRGEWRQRWGAVEGLHASQQERSLLGSFAVVF
ncbi:MAG TPA: DUF3943 domain-containing protein [Anaeromyxobacteraceae bacterium]|nr:DUF3943 domain-containing protein [Anaeromyxobacteraceae bacterium]